MELLYFAQFQNHSNMSPSTETFLGACKPEVRVLAQKVRELVREILPDAYEVVNASYKTITYGAGSSMSDEICYIAPLSSNVHLGFPYGTKLPDPEGLLKGTGKLLRHIKFDHEEEVERPGVRAILVAAKTHGNF